MQLRDNPDSTTTRDCDCTAGWREVTDVFARQEAKLPQDADLNAYAAAEHGTTERDAWRRYIAILNSVYPCPTCKPAQFHRWRHGCFGPDHVAARCRRCNPRDER